MLLCAAIIGARAANGQEADYYYLDIIYSNDVHGGIMPTGASFMNPEFPPPLGGGGSFANYVKQRREKMKELGGKLLLLDAGDCYSGTPIGTKTKGQAVVNFMNMIGYDAMVVGNHEFDKGYQALEKMMDNAQFPVLGANIIDRTTGKPPHKLKEYIIQEYNGLKIGIIGVGLTSTPTMALPENIGNYEFLPEGPVIAKLVPVVRPQCDILIVLTHMFLPYDPVEGWKDVEKRNKEGDTDVEGLAMHAANMYAGIDLMFTGHVHKGYYFPWEDPINHTLMLQTFGNGTSAGEIIVKVDKKTKTIAGYELPSEDGSLVTLFEDEFPPDNEIGGYIGREQAVAEAGMDDVIGTTKVNLMRGSAAENLMGMLITDAFRDYYDSDFAFTNVGGVRAEIQAGEITMRSLFKVMPFGNQLVRIKMKGSFMRKVVEGKLLSDESDRGLLIAGADITFNKNRPKWDRITKFLVRGRELEADKIYDVVTTDYLSEGNSGMELLLEIPQEERVYTQIPDLDVVERYIKKISPISIKPDDRLKRDDKSQQAPYLQQAMPK